MLRLIRDLKFVTSQRSFNFGDDKLSSIILNGKSVYPKIWRNGFIYQIPLPYDNFLRGDLHFTIFDNQGITVSHISYKPNGENTYPAYHYGKNDTSISQDVAWVSNPRGLILNDKKYILLDLEDLYYYIGSRIKISREIEPGIYKSPYNLTPSGTEGPRKNKTLSQQRNVKEIYDNKRRLFD